MKSIYLLFISVILAGCCTCKENPEDSSRNENGRGDIVNPRPPGPEYRHPDNITLPAPPIPD